MGAAMGTSCQSVTHLAQAVQVLDWVAAKSYNADYIEVTESSMAASLVTQGLDVPRLLRLRVPRGPVRTTGLYTLVENDQANGRPLWQATFGDFWLFSTLEGKWAVGGRREREAGFEVGAAYVFCDQLHHGRMPHLMPRAWVHNRPAWTPDLQITVESWPETITVALKKERASDRFGLQTSIELETLDKQDPGTLIVQAITEGSLLEAHNAQARSAGRLCEVVVAGSPVIRVGHLTEPLEMQEALLKGMGAVVEFGRAREPPVHRGSRAFAEEEAPAEPCATEASLGPPACLPKEEAQECCTCNEPTKEDAHCAMTRAPSTNSSEGASDGPDIVEKPTVVSASH